MAKARKKPARPVEGDVIGISALKMIASMIVCTILFLVGAGVLINYFTSDSGLSCWAVGVAVLMVLLAPAVIIFQAYLLRIKERLILGEDRFQVVHRVRSEDAVVTQILYRNIAEVTHEQEENKNRVGIDVRELDDLDTFDTKGDFKVSKNLQGSHYVIGGGYKEDLGEIYRLLAARLQQYAAKRP